MRTFLSNPVYIIVIIQAGYDAADSLFPSPPQSLLPPFFLDSHHCYLLNESYLQSHPHLIRSHPHIIHKLELEVHGWALQPVAFRRRFNSLSGIIQPPLTSPRLSLTPPTLPSLCLLAYPTVSQSGLCTFIGWKHPSPPIWAHFYINQFLN